VAFSLFGEVYVSEDPGASWRKIARGFGESEPQSGCQTEFFALSQNDPNDRRGSSCDRVAPFQEYMRRRARCARRSIDHSERPYVGYQCASGEWKFSGRILRSGTVAPDELFGSGGYLYDRHRRLAPGGVSLEVLSMYRPFTELNADSLMPRIIKDERTMNC